MQPKDKRKLKSLTNFIKGEKPKTLGNLLSDLPIADLVEKPDHEWNGTALRFETPDGEWGEGVDLKGEKGDKGEVGPVPVKGVDFNDGYTPVKGIDYFDGIDGYTPIKGVDYKDGKDGYTPIKGIDYNDGKDGSPDTAEQIVTKINALESVIDAKTIRGLDNIIKPINDRITSISNAPSVKGPIDQRWHGGGLSKVFTDTTLTGQGTAASPLKVVGGGGSGITSINTDTTLAQTLTVGTTGTDFAIVDNGTGDHRFNLPTASSTVRGALSTSDWTTFNNKQATLTLTTTGTSGAATLVGATLNIPQYAGGGSMVYPGAGIPLSTGSAWGTSISGTSAQFVKGDGSLDSSTYLTGITSSEINTALGLTASQIVATDVSGNLQSLAVATYPSLTELSYVKGVTSAIQTQINGKQASGAYEVTTNKATDFTTINNTLYPTVQAVNNAINTAVTGLLDYRGSYDASTNLYPATGGSGIAGAILKGDFWICSVAGTLGGVAVTSGDLIIAIVDTPGQTSTNWDLIQNNLGYTPENIANKVTAFSTPTDTQYPSAKLTSDQLNLKAPLASPTFTGTVTLPTSLTGIAKLSSGVVSAVTAPSGTIVGTTDAQTLTNKTLTTPVINGLPTGTGISSAATASTLVSRDSNGNIYLNNHFSNLTSTVSAGGTTILTIASSRNQVLTGSSSQTFQLPDATTLTPSHTFTFNNNSSGSLIINNAGGTAQYTSPAGGYLECHVTDVSTANGIWDFHPLAPKTVTWSSGVSGIIFNTALTTTPSINVGASSSTQPSFIPQRGSLTNGYGGDSSNLYGIIGGTAAFTASATSLTAPQFTSTVSTGTAPLVVSSTTPVTNLSIGGTASNLSGTPALPNGTTATTQSANDNSTKLATTAYSDARNTQALTITNKRNQPRVSSATSTSTLTPDLSAYSVYYLTAQAAALTIANPIGTPVIGEVIAIYVTDNGTSQTLTFGSEFKAYGAALPTATTISKTLMITAQFDGTNFATLTAQLQ